MNKGLSRQPTIQALKGQASMEVPQNNLEIERLQKAILHILLDMFPTKKNKFLKRSNAMRKLRVYKDILITIE